MKFMLLAYNPSYVNPETIPELIQAFKHRFDLEVIAVQHEKRDAQPIYCVEFVYVSETK